MTLPLNTYMLYDIHLVSGNLNVHNELLREGADAELVGRAQAGDMQAFEELVRRHRNDVFRLAFHFLRNREEAWDVSQEVFIKVYRSLGYFRGEANFKTWVLRITSNQCKDFFKKRRVETVAFEEDRAADTPGNQLGPGRAVLAKEIGNAIHMALARLPHKHRTAFVLREFEGLSYEEMAQVMQCSLGTVMSRLHHARKKLQQSLIHMGIAEERRS